MFKSKTFIAIFLFLMIVSMASVFGAGRVETEKDAFKIAVVPKALDNAVFLDTKDAAEAKGKELGVSIEWVGPQKSDASEQVNVLEGLIQKGVDAILVSCNDANVLEDVINRAVDSGIIVATFDSDSPNSKRSFYIGTNNYTLGVTSGEKMMELLPSGGNVAILTGVPGMPNLETRIQGFRDTIKGSRLEIVAVQTGNCDTQQSVDAIAQYTTANPTLDAWWVVGVWPFFADPASIPELRKFANQGGVTISIDAVYPQLAYVQEGTIDVLIGQDFGKMGSDGVEALYKMLTGDTSIPDYIDTGYVLVDSSNIKEVVERTVPW